MTKETLKALLDQVNGEFDESISRARRYHQAMSEALATIEATTPDNVQVKLWAHSFFLQSTDIAVFRTIAGAFGVNAEKRWNTNGTGYLIINVSVKGTPVTLFSASKDLRGKCEFREETTTIKTLVPVEGSCEPWSEDA